VKEISIPLKNIESLSLPESFKISIIFDNKNVLSNSVKSSQDI
jgi:hypothetical protein